MSTGEIVLWVLVALHALSIADAWMSRLSRTAQVLWTCVLLFMPAVGLFAWVLTRQSAHRPLPELPSEPAA